MNTPAASELPVLLLAAPHWARDDLANIGFDTARILIVADCDTGTLTAWAKKTGWLPSSTKQPPQAMHISAGSWQAQCCVANPGKVLGFRGDGRADPQRLAADLGGLAG